jgi:hypothetical protein
MRIVIAVGILLVATLAAAAATPEKHVKAPLAERLALQSDLVWSGDYNGLVDGNINAGTIAAIKSFQRGKGMRETGALDDAQRATLASTAKAQQNAAGWRMIDDARTGARLGLPAKLTPRVGRTRNGSRWSSNRGEVQIETFRYAASGAVFAALFEREKREPAGRKVDYSVMRKDFFVVSGQQGGKKFYVRAQTDGNEVRGVSILHDPAMDKAMTPVVVAMSSAFAGFSAQPSGAANPPRRPVEYGSAIVVSADGAMIAERELTEQCDSITVPRLGHADRVAVDRAGLALLRVYGVHGLKPMPLAGETTGNDVTLIGIADPQAQAGGSAVTTPAARLSADNAIAPAPQPGFAGATALDAQGRFAGMLTMRPAIVAGTGANAAPKAAVVSADTVRAFLQAHKVAPAPGRAGGGVEAAKSSVLRVACVRK